MNTRHRSPSWVAEQQAKTNLVLLALAALSIVTSFVSLIILIHNGAF